MAVLVVIDESAAGVPAALPIAGIRGDAGFSGEIGELAVAVVVPQSAVAPIGNKQVVPAVVVVVSRADALAPAGPRHAGLQSDICERAVAIVLIEAADRRLVGSPFCFEAHAVHKKNIKPAVVIVIEKGAAAAGGLEKELVLPLAAENRLGAQSSLTRHVDELNAERKAGHDLIEHEHRRRLAQRAHEATPGCERARLRGTHEFSGSFG